MRSLLPTVFRHPSTNKRLVAQLTADLALAVRHRQHAENDAALTAAVGLAITRGGDLRTTLQHCTQALVRHLNCGFAGIWVLDESQQMLDLRGSAGVAGGVDPRYRRVPVGTLTIGAIARERQPHFAPAAEVDTPIADPAWVGGERIVAFAGYPLLLDSKLIGVMAVFARHEISATDKDATSAVAAAVALAIDRKHWSRALLVRRNTA